MTIHHAPAAAGNDEAEVNVLWDRKVDGGFPETKELKRRVRDVIEPGRDLGHVDRDHAKEKKKEAEKKTGDADGKVSEEGAVTGEAKCEDCR